MTHTFLLKFKNRNSIILITIVLILITLHGNGAKPMYGSYPTALRPNNVEKLIDRIVAKYRTYEFELSPSSKNLIVNGLIEADLLIPDKGYGDLAGKIKNQKVTKEDLVLSTIQLDQIALCNEIMRLSKSDENIKIDKDFSSKVLRQSTENKEKAFRNITTKQNISAANYVEVGMYIFNTSWGIIQPIRMMWLDSYRVPVMRLFLSLSSCLNKKGELIHAERDVIADAAFVLAAAQMYRLTSSMAQPMPFVVTKEYVDDLNFQKRMLANNDTIPNRSESIKIMKRAAEAQFENLFSGSSGDAIDADRSWYRGSFLAGVVAAWRATGDEWYLNQATAIAQRTKCMPGPNAFGDANDLAIAQTYLELYEHGSVFGDYLPTQNCLDSLILKYNPKKIEWSWCDALFMSPPTWARMGKITKDNKYFQHLDKLWWQTSGLLYDEKEHLFYRDLKFTKQDDGFQIKERNGKKIFWGRGNGWVMGALCRVLDYLPEDFPSRSRYESMFKEMCKKLLILQGDDGLWRSSLLDPTSYPMGETSSSTFYCYAFAWGINHNLLNSQKFKPALEKSWRALCDCVDRKSGKLGFVQLPAESPRSAVYKRSNVEYATGAFLLAGSEIVQLMP